MLTVALTGGIASGKSIVAETLKQLGCFIHNADEIAHKIMESQKPAWKEIIAHFGEKILNPDKSINHSRLGEIVFSDEKERLFLNRLIHPLVMEVKKETINKLKKEGKSKIYISEAALTLEAGFIDFFDKVIIVYCKKDIQIKRLMERDNINRQEALKKISSQILPEQKLRYADYIIDSSESLQNTIEQTERVFRSLMIDYELKESHLD